MFSGVAVAAAAGLGSDAVAAALLAGGSVMLAVGAGLAVTGLALGFRSVEPAFALLAGSVSRMLLGIAAAYGVHAATAATTRPFWFAFLLVMLGVLAAEVVAAQRLLNAPREAGSA